MLQLCLYHPSSTHHAYSFSPDGLLYALDPDEVFGASDDEHDDIPSQVPSPNAAPSPPPLPTIPKHAIKSPKQKFLSNKNICPTNQQSTLQNFAKYSTNNITSWTKCSQKQFNLSIKQHQYHSTFLLQWQDQSSLQNFANYLHQIIKLTFCISNHIKQNLNTLNIPNNIKPIQLSTTIVTLMFPV